MTVRFLITALPLKLYLFSGYKTTERNCSIGIDLNKNTTLEKVFRMINFSNLLGIKVKKNNSTLLNNKDVFNAFYEKYF